MKPSPVYDWKTISVSCHVKLFCSKRYPPSACKVSKGKTVALKWFCPVCNHFVKHDKLHYWVTRYTYND